MPLTEPTRLVLRRELPADADADAYIAAVESADGQALEPGVKFAIKNFVLCCKQDGIWDAIKASCILAGARTLSGALVPLVGTAPTNSNFVAGDYNRKTGLVGNGSTKYLDSNRSNNADPQNDKHLACYVTTLNTTTANSELMGSAYSASGWTYLISRTASGTPSDKYEFGINQGTYPTGVSRALGFVGASRASASNYTGRAGGATATYSITSQTPSASDIFVYADGSATGHTNARIAFYSIGESLDLALLDARVTDLINAFGAAIP